jgi:hypothetical protein
MRLLGDVNQLAPVEQGCPFEDITGSGLMHT